MFETVKTQKPRITRDDIIKIILFKTPKVLKDIETDEDSIGFVIGNYYAPYGLHYDWKDSVKKKSWSFREPIWEPRLISDCGATSSLSFSMLDILSAKKAGDGWMIAGHKVTPLKSY